MTRRHSSSAARPPLSGAKICIHFAYPVAYILAACPPAAGPASGNEEE